MKNAELLTQALGFTPCRLRDQYRENAATKNYEQHILDRRQTVLAVECDAPGRAAAN
ncbi:MAG: hypothetical protein WBP11_09700 [Dokdonella sp.]